MDWDELFANTKINPYEILNNIHKKDTIIYPEYNNTIIHLKHLNYVH